MSDIAIKVSPNPNKESVFINHKIRPADKVVKVRDEQGNIIETKVEQSQNILSRGVSSGEVVKKVYGR